MRVEGINNLNFSAVKPEIINKENSLPKVEEISKQNIFSNENMVKKEEEKEREDFKGLVEDFDKVSIEIKNTRFEFSIHEETKRIIVKVYDKNTGELVNEIPPEKFLDLIANIWKQVGLIVDKKV